VFCDRTTIRTSMPPGDPGSLRVVPEPGTLPARAIPSSAPTAAMVSGSSARTLYNVRFQIPGHSNGLTRANHGAHNREQQSLFDHDPLGAQSLPMIRSPRTHFLNSPESLGSRGFGPDDRNDKKGLLAIGATLLWKGLPFTRQLSTPLAGEFARSPPPVCPTCWFPPSIASGPSASAGRTWHVDCSPTCLLPRKSISA